MDKALTDIVREKIKLTASIDPEKLKNHTNRSSPSKISWKSVLHFHILGTDASIWSDPLPENLQPGWYVGGNNTWVLALCCSPNDILNALANDKLNPELLDIRFTPFTKLGIAHLTKLRTLMISKQTKSTTTIIGLEHLENLQTLHFENIALNWNQRLDLRKMTSLEEMQLINCTVDGILLEQDLPKLRILYASHSEIYNYDFLQHCTGLRQLTLRYSSAVRLPQLSHLSALELLDLEHAKIKELPPLENLHQLATLDLSGTPVVLPEAYVFPPNLQRLNIRETNIHQLPESISRLSSLQVLDLSFMKLDTLPPWLIDLNLTIGKGSKFGINLAKTTIADMDDTSIFEQSQTIIQQWMAHQKEASQRAKDTADATDTRGAQDAEDADDTGDINDNTEKPLNEIKIIFLGDGGAGKTFTIARLREGLTADPQGKMRPAHYQDDSTPGIEISDHSYDIGSQKIRVHFWDFGGQDILCSMHRMFLTTKTLYVVLLNVREGNQDERARYWLQCIKSFTDNSPVLLVLNQMDHNRNAAVNESELRSFYPNLREDVVKISAATDSDDDFNSKLVAVLKKHIGSFAPVKYPFIPAWHRLKEELRNVKDNCIQVGKYNEICNKCGIDQDEKLRRDLLVWFNQLGISFCYNDDARLEDYVILKPEWITNALYMILFNMKKAANGMVSHKDIYELLGNESDKIKRVMQGVTYKPQEVDYVLHVIRRFHLSYPVDKDTEFIPMLCQNDTPDVSKEYETDGDTLEFRMEYEYLPVNILHRLMVELELELDKNNVWYTGARFVQQVTGLSAVVKAEGNAIRIFIRRPDSTVQPLSYLERLRESIHRICDKDNMEIAPPDEQIAYKSDDIVEYFNYETLLGSKRNRLNRCYSLKRQSIIPIDKILKQSTREVDTEEDQLVQDIISICQKLQDNIHYWNISESSITCKDSQACGKTCKERDKCKSICKKVVHYKRVSEDIRTTFIRDGLTLMGYFALDHTRAGSSELGMDAGEPDLKIRREANTEWTIFEALNLNGWGETQINYWNRHLNKLIDNYNSTRRPFLFHVSYVGCAKQNFKKLFDTYYQHMQTYSPKPFTVESWEEISNTPDGYAPNHNLRVARCVYGCGGYKPRVYHIFVHIDNRKIDVSSKQ